MRTAIRLAGSLAAVGMAVGGWAWGCGSGTEGGGLPDNSSSGSGTGGSACVPEDSELCDGVDNNCDGVVDEDCSCVEGETQDCYSGDSALVGHGACAQGWQTCDLNGQWGECEGEVLPTAEICDGLDNDCNDAVDEDLEAVVCGLGICQVTVEACDNGVPIPCVPGQPNDTETCDGTDDDCDGTVDEDCSCTDEQEQPCYTGSPQTQNVGECHDGTQICTGGVWGACVGDQAPLPNELCNGLDDDCDDQTDEGDPESGNGCDTGLAGICAAGVEHCVNGGIECVQTEQPGDELCDGLDNDCNPATGDGAADPGVNVSCDGPDSDLCPEGQTFCSGGTIACNDNTGDSLDVCNGSDDDCDTASSDGSEDPLLNAPCDGADTDLCVEGVLRCSMGALTCSDTTTSTVDLCNGVDDDCDPASPDGSEDPQLGAGCDGPDSDLCVEGVYSCSGGALACSDNTGGTPELCNGVDDDCNPATADGSGDPQLGAGCDGPDTDLCVEGILTCSGGALACSDSTTSTTDICNGVDDDCNPATADGSADPQLGAGCDGPDSDLCQEGVVSCSGGALTCSDNTPSTTDVCNGLDDDCDPASADGAEDPSLGAACDGGDLDLCLEGIFTCSGGALTCSDNTSSTTESCNGADDDCDGSVDEDYNRDDNPACSSGTFYLGSVDGDQGADTLSDSWYNEEWDRFQIFEDNDGIVYLSATVSLYSPPNTDFDLYAYCNNCTGGLADSSTVHSQAGHWDTVELRSNDDWGSDDSFDVILEIRHYSSSICAYWSLDIQGNTSVSSETCN